MKKRPSVLLGGLLIAVSGAAALAAVSMRTQQASAVSDPRQEPPIVRLATAAPVTKSERGFTGIVGARVQSHLGFRVAGKIVERYVDDGEQVEAGQPLMRIDDTDLRLALTAKRNAASLLMVVAGIWVFSWVLLSVAHFTPGIAAVVFITTYGIFAVGETMYSPVLNPLTASLAPRDLPVVGSYQLTRADFPGSFPRLAVTAPP